MKEAKFDLECTWETFMEAKNCFADASTSESRDKLELEMDPSMLTKFLETHINILRDSKVVKGLRELIDRCVGTAPREPRVVRKIGKDKARTGREMRLTVQFEEYEMDQVILDLGSYANVLPKQTWERMG